MSGLQTDSSDKDESDPVCSPNSTPQDPSNKTNSPSYSPDLFTDQSVHSTSQPFKDIQQYQAAVENPVLSYGNMTSRENTFHFNPARLPYKQSDRKRYLPHTLPYNRSSLFRWNRKSYNPGKKLRSIRHNPKIQGYRSISPTYRPISPTYRPISPTYRPISPTYRPITPTYRSISPTYRSISPTYRPISPTYRPITPTYRPITPTYRPISPTYRPISPTYRPVSPTYSPAASRCSDRGLTRQSTTVDTCAATTVLVADLEHDRKSASPLNQPRLSSRKRSDGTNCNMNTKVERVAVLKQSIEENTIPETVSSDETVLADNKNQSPKAAGFNWQRLNTGNGIEDASWQPASVGGMMDLRDRLSKRNTVDLRNRLRNQSRTSESESDKVAGDEKCEGLTCSFSKSEGKRFVRKNTFDLRDRLSRQKRMSQSNTESLEDEIKQRIVITGEDNTLTGTSEVDNRQRHGKKRIFTPNASASSAYKLLPNNDREDTDFKADCGNVDLHAAHQTAKSKDVRQFLRDTSCSLSSQDSYGAVQEGADHSQESTVPEGNRSKHYSEFSDSMTDRSDYGDRGRHFSSRHKRNRARKRKWEPEQSSSHSHLEQRESSKGAKKGRLSSQKDLRPNRQRGSDQRDTQTDQREAHMYPGRQNSSSQRYTQNDEREAHMYPGRQNSSSQRDTQTDQREEHVYPGRQNSSSQRDTQNDEREAHMYPGRQNSSSQRDTHNDQREAHIYPGRQNSSSQRDTQTDQREAHMYPGRQISSSQRDTQTDQREEHVYPGRQNSSSQRDTQTDQREADMYPGRQSGLRGRQIREQRDRRGEDRHGGGAQRWQRYTLQQAEHLRPPELVDSPADTFVNKCCQKSPQTEDPDNLCMFLAQNQNHLMQMLMELRGRREITDKLISLLHSALLKSSSLCFRSRLQMMNQLKECAFFDSKTIINVVKSLVTRRQYTPDENDAAVADQLIDIMKAMTEVDKLLREDTVVFLGSLQAALRTGRIVVNGEDITKRLMEKIEGIECRPLQPRLLEKLNTEPHSMDPKTEPLVPILPDIRDIRSGQCTGLAPHQISEPFSSATEYIRYLFLVFREDFIGPLCRGIRDYIDYMSYHEQCPQKREKFWNQDVRLYENVRVLGTALSNDTGIEIVVQIDSKQFRNFNSRLVYGSLVCLSSDGFKTVIYAAVSNSDKERLRGQGILGLDVLDIQQIDNDHEDETEKDQLTVNSAMTGHERWTAHTDLSGRFRIPGEGQSLQAVVELLQGRCVTMLESTAYYTAYVHSLKSLRTLHYHLGARQSSLPFKKQLLQLSKDMSPPRYFEASSGKVSFKCMKKYCQKANDLLLQLKQVKHQLENSLKSQAAVAQSSRTELCNELEDSHSKLWQEKVKLEEKYHGNIYQPGTWPSAADLGLDGSQYAALHLALTREVTLIQGPPGTGKTLLGVRIAELLLENQHLWRQDEHELLEKTPLLLLSYTNHALDQFLTELLSLPVLSGAQSYHVVRVGSRSEEEKLSEHNITKLRHARRTAHFYDLRNERGILDDFRGFRQDLDNQIQSYREGIVHHNHLCKRAVIAECHLKSLEAKLRAEEESGKRPDRIDLMLEWLCLDKHDLGCSLNQDPAYIHVDSLQKKGKRERKRQHHRKSTPHQKEGGSGATDATESSGSKIKTVSYDECEEGEIVDVEGEIVDVEWIVESTGLQHELNQYVDISELDQCEEEMDLEQEYERMLDLDEASDKEGEPSSNQQTGNLRQHEDEAWDNLDDFVHPDLHTQHEELEPPNFLLYREQGWLGQACRWHFPEKMIHRFPPVFLEKVSQKAEHELGRDDDIMTDEEAETVEDLWRLDVEQRWRLYRLWVRRLVTPLRDRRMWEENQFLDVSRRVEELRHVTDLRIMKNARVVAMTTTGAARYAAVLRELGPRIVLVEEAAQVPEAHLVSCLSPACHHLIMIGDHQQLRPSYTNYELTACRGQHHIDISLFERLCRCNIPYQRLSLQHRMRPEISSLLVPTIYPNLQNHDSVLEYPKVKGVKFNVFFLTHTEVEDTVEESQSKRNTHEAMVLASLYLYLRLQGYSEKDITVLALYKDQVLLLRTLIKKMEKDPRLPQPYQLYPEVEMSRPRRPRHLAKRAMGARVTAVDNFQGEENRIILLSLVRSNKQGRIGYLREDNRICVALSRAREGLFVVGNCQMLSKASPQCWKPILEKAQQSGWLGSALPLYCKAHNHITPVSSHTDIDKQCSNGGCSKICDYRKDCGHTCGEMCHASSPDLFHSKPCYKPCSLKCQSGHRCQGQCQQRPCPPCKEKCQKLCPVGHPCKKECGDICAPCQMQCELKLHCGHRCQAKCGMPCTTECQELEKVTGQCGHEFQSPCYMVLNGIASCRMECGQMLDCAHPCPGKCGDCFMGRLHVCCKKDCGRPLICQHECRSKCNQSCPPCNRPCEMKCIHSKQSCRKKCGEICQQCQERCQWQCRSRCNNHFRCNKLCFEMCERARCNQPCSCPRRKCKKCDCYYTCRGLYCERQCPPACPTCNADIFVILFGNEDEPDARFYQMPDCQCVLEVSGLDQYMDGWVSSNSDQGKVRPVVCPKCQKTVHTALRYGNIIKKAHADVEKVKERMLTADKSQLRNKQKELQNSLWQLWHWENKMTAVKSILYCRSFRYEKEKLSGHEESLQKWKDRVKSKIEKAKTLEGLTKPENQINFLRALGRLRQKLPEVSITAKNKQLCIKLNNYLERLESWVSEPLNYVFSSQQLTQFQKELVRADLTVTFAVAHKECHTMVGREEKKAEIHEKIQKNLHRLMSQPAMLTETEEKEMFKTIDSLKGQCLSTLGITNEEKIMIVKAMGFQKGHWFKCRNGHIYCISECGGAMQEGQCPDCGEKVGGGEHRLRDDNTLASEMDGAEFAAWSEQANMANYELN